MTKEDDANNTDNKAYSFILLAFGAFKLSKSHRQSVANTRFVNGKILLAVTPNESKIVNSSYQKKKTIKIHQQTTATVRAIAVASVSLAQFTVAERRLIVSFAYTSSVCAFRSSPCFGFLRKHCI